MREMSLPFSNTLKGRSEAVALYEPAGVLRLFFHKNLVNGGYSEPSSGGIHSLCNCPLLYPKSMHPIQYWFRGD